MTAARRSPGPGAGAPGGAAGAGPRRNSSSDFTYPFAVYPTTNMCQVQWQTSAMRKKLSMSLSCLRGDVAHDVADAYGIGGPCAVTARPRPRPGPRTTLRDTVIQLCCAVTSVWLKVPRALNASHFGLLGHAIRPHGPFGLGTLQCMDSLDMCSTQTDRLKMYAALTDAIGLVRWLGARARPGLMLPPISPHGVPASWLRT